MPWQSQDVTGKTKKAKSPKAKRQWVHIANRLLASGESEASAIKQANGVIKRQSKS